MKATDVLRQHHEGLKALFSKLQRCTDEDRPRIFQELQFRLETHGRFECEFVYPVCDDLDELQERLRCSLVEHGVIEFLLQRCQRALGGNDLEYHVLVLQEAVVRHVQAEEQELLPNVEAAFDAQQLHLLGRRMLDSETWRLVPSAHVPPAVRARSCRDVRQR